MLKTLFKGLALLSLLVVIATTVFWIRSYWQADRYVVSSSSRSPQMSLEWSVNSAEGRIRIGRVSKVPATISKQGVSILVKYTYSPGPPPPEPQFHYEFSPSYSVVVFPHWFAVLIASILPAVWLIRQLRQRRLIDTGHCRTCGYDLRASTERCPECGTPIASESKSN